MVRNDVNIHPAQLVHWTRKLRLFVRSQVAQIQDSQFPEREQHAKRSRIFGLISQMLRGRIATCVDAASTG